MLDINRAAAAPAWLAAKAKPYCLLCRRRSAFVAEYIPAKGTTLAAESGHRRIIVYSLCKDCAQKADVLVETIEARIESELRDAELS